MPDPPMDRAAVRDAWDRLAEPYAATRDPDGPDAALIESELDLSSDDRALDLGCGDGARTLANLPRESVGLDLSRRCCELARDAGHRAVQGEMTALPFDADSFDAATAYHAVFHVPRADHGAVYREVARVLRPGAPLLATVGSGRSESVRRGWLGTDASMLFSSPGGDETERLLRDAGFAVAWRRRVADPFGGGVPMVLARAP
ncbi:MAG: methylase involved in ubiquinone/menaquinone biosynthesis [uncultured archaeon A07HB70]|nr:MAG: methylase involved in ubiquinone/menaquinone biosynthesis [uncultured archaeon A07HB70]